MERHYTIREHFDSIYSGDSKTIDTLNNYKYTFSLLCALLKDYFNLSSFSIHLMNESYDEEKKERKISFEIVGNKTKYTLEINNDYYTITSENMKYTWKMWEEEAELVAISRKEKDKIMTQEFFPHSLKIRVEINNYIWEIILPIDIYYTLDFELIDKIIKQTTKVEDLKRFYVNYFYPNQTNYDKTLNTIISYSIIKNEEKIELDRLVIKGGKVASYLFSIYKDDIIFSIQDGMINIQNYTLDSKLDLNSEVVCLLQRSKKQK